MCSDTTWSLICGTLMIIPLNPLGSGEHLVTVLLYSGSSRTSHPEDANLSFTPTAPNVQLNS